MLSGKAMTVSLSRDLNEFLGERYILVIEPKMNFRVTIQNFLARLKCPNVKLVGSISEARQEIQTKKIGFFIAEWLLPEKNGLEFCREIRKDQRHKSTPYLLLTTENLKADIVLASEGGISACLLKPFSYQDFCDQLRLIVLDEKNPSHVQSLIERAEAYFEQKEFWVAEALFCEALTLKPNSARAMCGIGQIELANQNSEKAIMCFKQAVKNNPEYIEGYKQLLKLSEKKNDHEGIIQGATILHRLSPENPRYPLMIAASQMELGRFLVAEEFFKITVKLSPSLAAGYRGLGNLYLRTKEFQKAAQNLEKALDIETSDVPTLNSLGMAYVRQNLIDKGIDRYKLALTISPEDPRVLFNLGLALEIKGRFSEAFEAFHKASKVDPNFDKARRKLEQIKVKLPADSSAHKLATAV